MVVTNMQLLLPSERLCFTESITLNDQV